MPPDPPERDPQDERDRELVAKAQAGDEGALGEWLERMQDRVFAVAYRMVGKREDAADVTQDVFVQLIKGLQRYDGRARVGTWVYRIAMNVAISHLRREGRRRHASLDAPTWYSSNEDSRPTSLGAAIPDADMETGLDTSADQEQARAQHEKLQDALNELSDEHRGVMVLRDVMGLDYQQVAEALELPVGTVKSRLFRARLALRDLIDGGESSDSDGSSAGQPP